MTTHQSLLPAVTTGDLARMLPSSQDLAATRRGLILAPLLAALPLGLLTDSAAAIDANETQVTLPDQFQWKSWSGAPPHSSETAAVFGATDKPGPYVVLIKWYPGYMSAPHTLSPIGCALSYPARGG